MKIIEALVNMFDMARAVNPYLRDHLFELN
jgi:hypothetical protein